MRVVNYKHRSKTNLCKPNETKNLHNQFLKEVPKSIPLLPHNPAQMEYLNTVPHTGQPKHAEETKDQPTFPVKQTACYYADPEPTLPNFPARYAPNQVPALPDIFEDSHILSLLKGLTLQPTKYRQQDPLAKREEWAIKMRNSKRREILMYKRACNTFATQITSAHQFIRFGEMPQEVTGLLR